MSTTETSVSLNSFRRRIERVGSLGSGHLRPVGCVGVVSSRSKTETEVEGGTL